MKAPVLFITGALLSLTALTAVAFHWKPLVPAGPLLPIANVPEPAVMIWVGLGLMGLSGALRKLRK